MKDFFSKIDKKYLLILGGILGAIILVFIILVLVKSCDKPGSDYEKVEQQMITATEKFLKSKGQSLPKEFESKEISASELAAAGFMKEMSKLLTDTSCVGKVAVYNYSGQYLYIPDLNCTDYKTKHLADVIKKDNLVQVVSNTEQNSNQVNTDDPNTSLDDEEPSNTNNSNARIVDPEENDGTGRNYVSGLYEVDGEYVFKGLKPNNFLQINGVMFRIIDIDSNGLMRIINISQEKKASYWDNKYNSDVKKSEGINEYKNSYIYNLNISNFAKYRDENKKHFAYNKLCVGKRQVMQTQISKEMDCALSLEKQYIMLPLASDYARASLDEHCTKINSAACRNYNYLARIITSSWTSNVLSDNTYEVIAYSLGRPRKVTAKEKNNYNIVLTINGYEKFVGGKGTQNDPYLVGPQVEKKKK